MPHPIKNIAFAVAMLISLATSAQFSNVAATVGADIAGNKDGGVSIVDFNNDGCLDILVNTSNGTYRTRLLQSDCNYPDPSFTDVTATLAPHLLDGTLERSCVWGDYNNDGYLDFARNRAYHLEVYLNQGPGGDPAWSFGDGDHEPNYEITTLTNGLNCEGLAWLDYEGDGFLDLILENHNYGVDILENPGDCTSNFTHVTPNSSPLGLYTSATDGDYMATADYNDDGWVDLLVRKKDQNDLLRNDGGSFTDIMNIDDADNGNKGAVIFADFDNDGDFDLFWTANGTTQIWEQTSTGSFSSTGEPATSASVTFGTGIDGCAAGDVDNDGDLDLFVADDSGASYLFTNESTPGNFSFTHNNRSIYVNGDAEGCVFADYDADGDMDLYVNRSGGNQLWRNSTNNSNYLFIEPLLDLGGGFTRVDHGATAVLKSSDGTTIVGGIRDAHTSFGHGCMHASSIHFGLPDGPDETYQLLLNFTNIGGERVQVDTLITPSDLTDQTFRYVRDSFGVLSNIGCNLLPVELNYFKATPQDKVIEVEWATYTEHDNDYFILERSADGSQWEKLAQVTGAGTTLTPQFYQFTDPFPLTGINYYRLKQVDYNGAVNGPWLTAASMENDAFSLRLYPNPILPAHDSWYIQLSGLMGDAEVTLIGSGGKIIETYDLPFDRTHATLELNKPSDINPGVYFVKVRSGSHTITRKLLFR
ncbi:T9SS type A sorting domain-containing protein [Sanyastnella coralliicola]|uniref:T9SS type A sorting domain-containing protein n=1 Tax=Sanyastnella coralliicola TaxID=3069118 RepID=UPI0027BA68D6|nr:T9SS type A sorting domain-containing protein [Longitalea sp. SCSIO 12813]